MLLRLPKWCLVRVDKSLLYPRFLLIAVLSVSDTVKYLGVLIDSKLHFAQQATAVSNKCRQRLFIVKRFAFLGAEQRLIRQLFRSFIGSYVFYCEAIFLITCRIRIRDISVGYTILLETWVLM